MPHQEMIYSTGYQERFMKIFILLKSLKVSKLWIITKLFIMISNLKIIWSNSLMVEMIWLELTLSLLILVWLVRIQKVELQFTPVQNASMSRQRPLIFFHLAVSFYLWCYQKSLSWRFYLFQLHLQRIYYTCPIPS